jgi:ABC-type oligopeptide transport system substrate-binding subunit
MVMQKFKIFFLFLLIGVLVSCTQNNTDQKTLRIHLPVYKLVLDPHKMADLYSMAVITQIYRGLLRYNAPGDVVPDIAESWTQSPDQKIYRFKLKTTTFSNGSPITATNVQMSFARIFYVGSSIGADIDYIEGTKKFRETKNIDDLGIKVIAPDLVEFHLSKPSALFLIQLAVTDCAVLPLKKFDETLDFTAKGIFSGPYKITKTPDDTGLTLKKWRADAHDSKNPPQTVSYVMSDKSPVQLAMEGITDTLDHDKVTEVESNELQSKGWAATPTELTGEAFVILNPHLISKELRAYLYSVIDPKELVQKLGGKTLTPAFGLIPKGLHGELEESLISELKNKKIYTGPKITIELEYEKTSEIEIKIVNFLKEKWQHPKIDLKLVPLVKSENLGRMFQKKSQAVVGRKSVDYPDGYSVLTYFKSNYDSNYFHVNDLKIDAALLAVIQIFDPKQRELGYKEIQKLVLSHYTVVPLFFGSEASGLWSNKVLSVPSHTLGYHTLPVESIEMR